MTSVIYTYGMEGQFIVAENPDVVEQIVEDASVAGDMFVTLNSAGKYVDPREAMTPDGKIDVSRLDEAVKDSFVPIKIRTNVIVAVRAPHANEQGT